MAACCVAASWAPILGAGPKLRRVPEQSIA
jgi:hypothetical protein